jgi:hypothetical protein
MFIASHKVSFVRLNGHSGHGVDDGYFSVGFLAANLSVDSFYVL